VKCKIRWFVGLPFNTKDLHRTEGCHNSNLKSNSKSHTNETGKNKNLKLPWIPLERQVKVSTPEVKSSLKLPLAVSKRVKIPNPLIKREIAIKTVNIDSQVYYQ